MKHLLCVLFACLMLSGAFAQGYKIENGIVKVDGEITFVKGTKKLTPESEPALKAIKKYLEDKTYITLLRVEGHVDGEGDNNQSLSETRALAVCGWLIANGINCKRLIAVGFGDTKPLSYTNGVVNTRIAFVNAALRDHLIGGMPADGGGKQAVMDLCTLPPALN